MPSDLETRVALLEQRLVDLDRLYDTRFQASEDAVAAALAAKEKQATGSFLASIVALLTGLAALLRH